MARGSTASLALSVLIVHLYTYLRQGFNCLCSVCDKLFCFRLTNIVTSIDYIHVPIVFIIPNELLYTDLYLIKEHREE